MTLTHLSPVQTSAQLRDAAHEGITDACDLIGSLNLAAQFPRQLTESDKEVLRHRLKCLTQSVERVCS